MPLGAGGCETPASPGQGCDHDGFKGKAPRSFEDPVVNNTTKRSKSH